MEKVWLKCYPPDVPADINPDQYRSLVEIFERSCCQFGRRQAFACMGRSLTYNELEQKSRTFAAYLQQDLQLAKGERVALLLPNLLQYPVALFGVLRAGLVAVNIDPLSVPSELKQQLHDSGAKVIVILANFAHVLAGIIGETAVETAIVTEIGDLLSYWKAKVINLAIKHIKKTVPAYVLPNAVAFQTLLTAAGERSLSADKVSGEDLALLHYTRGITGVPKGVMLSHRNLVANVEQCLAFLGPELGKSKEEIMVTALPLHQLFCLTVNCFAGVRRGGLNVLLANPRDIPVLIAEMRHTRLTAITGDDGLFAALTNHPKVSQIDFSGLKVAVGSGVVGAAVAARWQAITGVPILASYGLTEAGPLVCLDPLEVGEAGGRVGLPLPSTAIELRSATGIAVEPGERGELCVHGPQVMRGYWQRPEETACVLRDGWLLTGDVATIDENGFVRIVGRQRDRICVSGHEIFPDDIERVLQDCEGVLEVACVGVPDDKTGQAIKIAVVRKPGAELTGEMVLAHCYRRLTAQQMPRHIEFRDSLPKSRAGEVLRRALC
ncbi:Long-chain-fatty-acid--CoA ligase [Candidatus Competibacter denitrificans Run_A_D11]|uniref:Long-chain-fatty-acid--CoA ligase n=1 Tax=Candidatus Competibacter denitrificans Run_A_D11 TaxID=1400863 RepID=W6M0W9_9GAMM|nr:AMP-binding protein [Candidatus Competibacter denitrificans]CDI01042.1 Long-chain-fatty-acid--CoA ligase [Candidatus Competibacter denitrificans Run_A_D11]HAS87414.1 long-chain-fatty-acid--CoA ligase [Candidatus Competibacteraceae bacterium]HRC68999.1 AMP-binding protein [Candidatus Competibacter denitrificans]